jgi:hypothetical protein
MAGSSDQPTSFTFFLRCQHITDGCHKDPEEGYLLTDLKRVDFGIHRTRAPRRGRSAPYREAALTGEGAPFGDGSSRPASPEQPCTLGCLTGRLGAVPGATAPERSPAHSSPTSDRLEGISPQ